MNVNPSKTKKAKFVKALVSGKNIQESAMAAGYAPSSAPAAGSAMVRMPDIMARVDAALDAQGLSIERCAAEVKKGLEQGKVGAHDTYLELAFRLRNLGNRSAATNNTQINILSPDAIAKLVDAYNASQANQNGH